jgi:hypothetical protein
MPHQAHNPNNYWRAIMSAPPHAIAHQFEKKNLFGLWEPSMGTSHMFGTSVTNQSKNRKRLRSLVGLSRKSTNQQVYILFVSQVLIKWCISMFFFWSDNVRLD